MFCLCEHQDSIRSSNVSLSFSINMLVLISQFCRIAGYFLVQRLAEATKKLEAAQASLRDAKQKLKEVSFCDFCLHFHFC